jgi:hypothetical protein
MQVFKGDDTEMKMIAVGLSAKNPIGISLDRFYSDAYGSIPLGELIYDMKLAPLANAIKRELFISSFKELFESFPIAGTFESYISVLKKIFGEDVQIDFTVQSGTGLGEYVFVDGDGDTLVDSDGDTLVFGLPLVPGKLEIGIRSTSTNIFTGIFREIEDSVYVEYDFVDSDNDTIVFTSLLGVESESEIRSILFSMSPNGIVTDISLTFLT